MEKTRCRFTCQSVKASAHAPGEENLSYDYEFSAVSGKDGECNQFWKWTPNGEMRFTCTAQRNLFIPGHDYYIDISAVEPIPMIDHQS